MKTSSSFFLPFKFLFTITLGYLLIPSLLFLGGWVRWYFAVPSVAIFLVVFFQIARGDVKECQQSVSWSHAGNFIIPLIAAYVTYATGVRGMVGQCYNYVGCDNLKLFELIVHPWPVAYPAKDVFYCYYIGYNLPIAALTKLTGNIHLAEFFSFVWAWLE